MSANAAVPFLDLKAQYRALENEIKPALEAVMSRGDFILGEAVERFEASFASWIGSRHAIGVASGLDALHLSLAAIGVGPGDEVLLPANTFIATAFAVSAAGATPVLVDCGEDSQVDVSRIEAAITPRTRAMLPVHLYGHPADMPRILAIAAAHRIAVIEDSAQAHGATLGGKNCGTFGVTGCFSFHPSKNLGAYGDGGIVVTDDDGIAATLRQLRNYGQRGKNEHVLLGGNSRLDSLQAAVLDVKLRHLDAWNAARARNAARYDDLLAGAGLALPSTAPEASHVFHLYVVRSARRDELRAHLEAAGIQTGVHYPVPVHMNGAYAALGHGRGAFPVAETFADEVLSLPVFPELTGAQIERVADSIRGFLAGKP